MVISVFGSHDFLSDEDEDLVVGLHVSDEVEDVSLLVLLRHEKNRLVH